MKKDWEPRQSRATTHFKFYSEKYLWGSTRAELLPDERSVWIDFLCLATMSFGEIEVFSRDQLAHQLLISRELLDRSIEKFIRFGKVHKKYNKREKKEIFSIVNWSRFQAEYLTKRHKKSTTYGNKSCIEESRNDDTENQPTLEERKEEKRREEEKRGFTPQAKNPSKTIDIENQNLPKNMPFELRDQAVELKEAIRKIKANIKGCEKKEEDWAARYKAKYERELELARKELTGMIKSCQ